MNWKVFGITVCIGFAINVAILYCIGVGGDIDPVHEQEVEINEPNIKVVSIEVVEPNEPEFELTFCEATMSLPYKDNLFDSIPTCPDYNDPNEPEYTEAELALGVNYLYGDGTPPVAHYNIEYFIPTWPDYIELEKDLVCFPPDDNDVTTVGDGIEHLLLTKGTKIYFK